MFSTNPLEMFFGQSRQRVGGNFYIDVVGVISAAKVQRLHHLIKNDIIPTDDAIRKTCVYCEVDINEEDLNIVGEFNIDDAQELLNSTDPLKHKVVYIAGFLSRKNQQAFGTDVVLSTEFLDELNIEYSPFCLLWNETSRVAARSKKKLREIFSATSVLHRFPYCEE